MHADKPHEPTARQSAHDEFYLGEKSGTRPFVAENTVDSRDAHKFVSNDKASHGEYSESIAHGCEGYINQLNGECDFSFNAENEVQLEGAAKPYGKRDDLEHSGSKTATNKFTRWLQDVPLYYKNIAYQQFKSQDQIAQWSDRYVESGQHKKIKVRQGLDEIIDDPCKLNESLNNIQDPQEQVSPNDNIQEFQAHMSESDIEHIILQPAIYSRPEACTKVDSNNFNRSIRMPSNDLNNGATTNQVNDHKSGESVAESIRGSSEFEISAVHLSESPSGVHNISDCQLTRSQSSHWNKECANMPVWGQVKNEILSGTALGYILTSTDAAVNKSGNLSGKMNMKHVVSSKCGDDNLDNERRVRGRIDQPVRTKGASDTFIRGNSRAIRPTSGKDRHSKVNTSKGPRDRRVRLSVPTAVQFYDVQDRLGYDQPSKAVEWLMKEAKVAIDELWQLPFTTSTENSSKTNLADSSLHESSHNQVSSTLASNFSDTLTPPAPALLRSISQFGRYCSQSTIHEECDAQSLNEKSESKQIITGASVGENSELHTTEQVNSHVPTELKNKSKGEAKESVEENHVISGDNSSQMHSISASASFEGYQLHRSPSLNASYVFAKDIQTSLVNYMQEPAHPWQFISNGTHQERSEGLGTLSQSHAYTPIQGPYPQNFDFSYDKHQQSAEEVIIQNPVYKASNNSKISAGFEKYGAISSNILSHSKINTCSCTTTCSKVLSSYRDDNSMSRTPSISQFCPVTNSAERTPAMHYFSDQTFKNPTINTLLPLNPCTLSSSNSALLKQKLNLEGLQLQGVMRSPNWHSGSNLDQNTFLRLPSRISTSSSILPPYLTNNSSEDVPAIPRMLSSSRESNSFTLIDHNDVLPSSKHTRPSPLFLRSQFPTRIQGFDELHDVMKRPPQ